MHQRTELGSLTFWFNLDKEKNIPSAYSACSLVLCALLLGYIARAKRTVQLPSRHWWILAIIFVFLGLDEYVKIHERLTIPLRQALHASGVLYYAWIIPYGLLTLTLCASYGAFSVATPEEDAVVMHLRRGDIRGRCRGHGDAERTVLYCASRARPNLCGPGHHRRNLGDEWRGLVYLYSPCLYPHRDTRERQGTLQRDLRSRFKAHTHAQNLL